MKFGQEARPQPPAEPGTFAERLTAMLCELLRCGKPLEPLLPTATVEPIARQVAEAVAGQGRLAGDKARTLMEALRDPLNDDLRRRVRAGEVKAEDLIKMDENDLMNPVAREKTEGVKAFRALARNTQELLRAQAVTSDMFPCPACGKRNCTMVQKQTRSGDEPMTVYCTCLDCGRAFRRM
jgi:transcription elongation factor S-II